MRLFLVILVAGLIGAGCKSTAESPAVDLPSEVEEPAETQKVDGIKGTVTYIQLEGGFYGIKGDDGESYMPLNLKEEFKEDGLRVVFTVKERRDVMTITMWGKNVQLLSIKKL